MNDIEILENKLKLNEKTKFDWFGEKEFEAIEKLIKEYKELKEYKKISELTKVSCCTAQNCEALNKAIKNGLENVKLLQENKELKEKNKKITENCAKFIEGRDTVIQQNRKETLDYVEENFIPKSKVKEKIEKYIKADCDMRYDKYDIQTILLELLEN